MTVNKTRISETVYVYYGSRASRNKQECRLVGNPLSSVMCVILFEDGLSLVVPRREVRQKKEASVA